MARKVDNRGDWDVMGFARTGMRSPVFGKRGKFTQARSNGDDNGVPRMRSVQRGIPMAARERDHVLVIAAAPGLLIEPCSCCSSHQGQLCIDCAEGGCQ